MRTILFILQKEFRQIFRNRAMLPIIFVVPLIQLLILANAATFEIRNIKLVIVDLDQSSVSRKLAAALDASEYFQLTDVTTDRGSAYKALAENQADLVVEVPRSYHRSLVNRRAGSVQLTINAIDGVKAGLGQGYFSSVFRQVLNNPDMTLSARVQPIPGMKLEYSNWYNQDLDYKVFMVPGILVLLVTMIGTFLSGMNVVREKEIGTIEQLNVTPIKKYQFIAGKLLPFLALALFELAIGLLLAKLIYDTPMVGSLWLIFAFSIVYLILVLGIGLLISTITETQQQSMFFSWFFLVIFILMSGLFTPIENMPLWAQKITLFNPVRYFIEVMRMVMLKGSGLAEVKMHFLIIAGYGLAVLGLAVWRYRKTV